MCVSKKLTEKLSSEALNSNLCETRQSHFLCSSYPDGGLNFTTVTSEVMCQLASLCLVWWYQYWVATPENFLWHPDVGLLPALLLLNPGACPGLIVVLRVTRPTTSMSPSALCATCRLKKGYERDLYYNGEQPAYTMHVLRWAVMYNSDAFT